MKKRNWFWNLVIFLTVALCLSAFVLHYKNWVSLEDETFTITSGIYRETIPVHTIAAIDWVEKIPQMERKNGFSWGTKEKGFFKDSIASTEAFVFVDDLKQQKVRLTYKDSLLLYFNFTDSLATQKLYQQLHASQTQQEQE